MDDDIDIEEHDLLDNPRIKSIFPDLARVKIEIPDEEDIDEQYEDVPTDYQRGMQYQYDYNFETNAETSEQAPEESDERNEYGESETYFHNNEIILGSKPAVDYHVLYEEALNSIPVVFLENWEFKLKSSPCFCETCNILFPTVNALDAHKMVSHSYLVALDVPQRNTARKSTVTSKYCNHCSKTFPDDTSLIKHLYELLPLNNFPKVNKSEETVVENPQFRCQKCKKTFTTHEDGKWHKQNVHPALRHVNNLIIRIQPKKLKPKIDVKLKPKIDVKLKTKVVLKSKDHNKKKGKIGLLKRQGKIFESSSLVPKSTLFQCNVCQVGFLSCFGAIQHSKFCENALPFNKCGICKRKIRTKDEKVHALQHNYNDKLKIYTIHKNIYEKVLCKCPKCLACFDELFFWTHYKDCDKSGSAYCPDCDLNIAQARYESHRLKHISKKFTKKDFIIIEFDDQDCMKKPDDMRIQMMRTQRRAEKKEKQKQKTEKRGGNREDSYVTLYYCENCGCCQSRLQFNGHLNGLCKKRIHSQYCDKCGLRFTNKAIHCHRVLHEKQQFSLKNIRILSLTTGEQIDPPQPDMYMCKKCDKHFIYPKLVKRHNCQTEKHIICNICSKKFNLHAYKIHSNFHSLDVQLIPELMKKYDSINLMWNVIYMCLTCDLVTLTYDSAVEHSQYHIINIQNGTHKICKICDFKIAERDFKNHERLHKNNKSINKKSFKILKYNSEDLFKNDWMALFHLLPKQHEQQILSKSIYRYTRMVKMHLEISAPTDKYKVFCMSCKKFINGNQIQPHLMSKCKFTKTIPCRICDEMFNTVKLFLIHEDSHEKGHNIITFNNKSDKDFNEKLLIKAEQFVDNLKPHKSKLRELLMEGVKKKYKIYKCAKCLACVFLRSSMMRHHCIPENDKSFCKICQQYFSHKKMSSHEKMHTKSPYITKDTLSVVFFNGNVNKNKKICPSVSKSAEKEKKKIVLPVRQTAAKEPALESVANLYQCECGLHFTSMKTIQQHLDVCHPSLNISKDICSKCNLEFPTDLLVTHLCNHHSKAMKIVIEKVKKVNLMKCNHCLLLFRSTDHFNSHTENCNPKNGKKCKHCHLNFNKLSYFKHNCSIKDQTTYINKITVMNNSSKVFTVYRCEQCNISYLVDSSYRYHIEMKHINKIHLYICEYCGLRFTKYSSNKHLEMHRNSGDHYRIKVVDPVTRNSVMLTGKNPIKGAKSPLNKSPETHETDEIENKTDINKSLPKKRKLEKDTETNSALNKKGRKSMTDTLRKIRKCADITSDTEDELDANTSKDTDTDNESEVILSDNKSDHTFAENVSNDISQDSEANTSDMSDTLSDKLKSRIFVRNYNNKLFRCIYCNQHLMKDTSFDYHIKRHKIEEPENFKCEICFLDFSKYTLPRHKYVHHEIMGFKKEDFVILTETPSTKLSDIHRKMGTDINNVKSDNENQHDDEFIKDSTKYNKTDSENSHSSSENKDNNSVTESVSDINEIIETDNDNKKFFYYKCSECNVCFINPKTCYNHTFKHETLDPKTYIQCKICAFQFMIDSLKDHMDVHHTVDFRVEDLTIKEYKPEGEGMEPKIDIYQAVDKVQSRLISTTTDVGVV